MRQLGEGVQSEERQMLLPFLRHLSLRPAAASWQTVLVGNDLRIVLFWLAGNSPGAGEVAGSSPASVTISMKKERMGDAGASLPAALDCRSLWHNCVVPKDNGTQRWERYCWSKA
jgi:hypothetical protein